MPSRSQANRLAIAMHERVLKLASVSTISGNRPVKSIAAGRVRS
jgi:hypothetical protein